MAHAKAKYGGKKYVDKDNTSENKKQKDKQENRNYKKASPDLKSNQLESKMVSEC